MAHALSEKDKDELRFTTGARAACQAMKQEIGAVDDCILQNAWDSIEIHAKKLADLVLDGASQREVEVTKIALEESLGLATDRKKFLEDTVTPISEVSVSLILSAFTTYVELLQEVLRNPTFPEASKLEGAELLEKITGLIEALRVGRRPAIATVRGMAGCVSDLVHSLCE